MKVYIVISFNKDDVVRVEKVFANLEDAQERVNRLESGQDNSTKTFHIVTKSVNGLLSYGIPSKGRIKIISMTMDYYRLQVKVDNQKEYIKKLETRVQELKLENKDVYETNCNLRAVLDKDLDYESQANDNYVNRIVKHKDGHVYLANGDVWENSDFDEYRPKGNSNIQD